MTMIKFWKKSVSVNNAAPTTAYLVFAPTSIFASAISTSNLNLELDLNFRLLVSSISYLGFLAIIKLLLTVVARRGLHASITIGQLIIIGAFAGLLKGYATSALLHEAAPTPLFNSRALSAGFLGILTVPTLAVVSQELGNLRATANSAVMDLLRRHNRELKSNAIWMDRKSELTRRITTDISNGIQSALTEMSASNGSPNASRNLLEGLIAQHKELTNELITLRQPELKADQASLFAVLRMSLRNFILPGWMGATIATPSSVAFLNLQQPNQNLPVQLALIASTTWLGFATIRYLVKLYPKKILGIWICGTVAMAFTPFLFNHFVYAQSLPSSILVIAIYSAWLFVINLVGSSLRAFALNPNLLEDELVNQVTEEEVLQHANEIFEFQLAQELADFIHGRIQSRLMASVLLVETPTFSKQDLARELEELLQIVANASARDGVQPSEPATVRLRQITDTWQGLLKVHGSDSLPDCILSPETLAAIEEALLNASRHGNAENIWLTYENPQTLEIADDGRGPQPGLRGLGSSIYDRAASSWQLKRGQDGIGSIVTLNLR